jgi:hypothetical protein
MCRHSSMWPCSGGADLVAQPTRGG